MTDSEKEIENFYEANLDNVDKPDDRAGWHDWENLRRAFKDSEIGILCQPLRKDGERGECGDCGKWHKLPSIPLSYVGHADITARLNEAEWSWRPLGVEPTGVPALVVGQSDLFLWIELTIWDRSVIEVGAVSKGKSEAMKHLVSDALRRAAMRFGIALDLWKKEKWEPEEDVSTKPGPPSSDAVAWTEPEGRGAAMTGPGPPSPAPPPSPGTPPAAQGIIRRDEDEEGVTGARYAQEITRCIRAICPGQKWMEWIIRELTAWERAPKGYSTFRPFNDKNGHVQTSVVFRKWEALAKIDEPIPGRGQVGAAARAWVLKQGVNASLKAHRGTAAGTGEEDYDGMTESVGPPDVPPLEDDDLPF